MYEELVLVPVHSARVKLCYVFGRPVIYLGVFAILIQIESKKGYK